MIAILKISFWNLLICWSIFIFFLPEILVLFEMASRLFVSSSITLAQRGSMQRSLITHLEVRSRFCFLVRVPQTTILWLPVLVLVFMFGREVRTYLLPIYTPVFYLN